LASLGSGLIVINRVAGDFPRDSGRLNLATTDESRQTGTGGCYRSGAIGTDAVQRLVTVEGTPAKIGARAFDVLLVLVERRERVVSNLLSTQRNTKRLASRS
jgi:hypothetical protein